MIQPLLFVKYYKWNSFLAIVFGILLVVAETIRRYGAWGHWSWWMDDYILGTSLIVSAIFTLKKKRIGIPFLLASWGMTTGLLYGSFFSKLTDPQEEFHSNIEPSLLINLIGFGFITAVIALVSLLVRLRYDLNRL